MGPKKDQNPTGPFPALYAPHHGARTQQQHDFEENGATVMKTDRLKLLDVIEKLGIE